MYILFLLLTGLITIVFGQDNYPKKIQLDSSNGFSVEYFNNYKIVHNLLNNEKYMLVCCGMTLDNNTGYTGVFSTPIQNIAVDSALYTLPFFELLNLTNHVQAIVPANNVTSPCYANLTATPQNSTNLVTFTVKSNSTSSIGVSANNPSLTPLQVPKTLLGQATMETKTFSDLTEFQKALNATDFVIDESSKSAFKDLSFDSWLIAANFSPSSGLSFISGKAVYRTDGLVNTNGYSDYAIRHYARPDLAIFDIIHMVYPTYGRSYNLTWLLAFAQSGRPLYVSNATYPSCTNPGERIYAIKCVTAPFDPRNNATSNVPKPSNNPFIQHGLSTGGVIAAVAAISVIGTFVYRKTKHTPKERTFYRMQDL
ncbi:hypothetical protein BCV72DRAFT_251825 [Rhizopus microsporus var. microsporus]|uniref:Uncharacterized protein n=1 Tax=Rhizopus microsporus var. microsporus TaxID=86635 RepID=A0A1X0QUL0_RHIZD|nr:hypothetical protein BCV72DRAFT_251825 [Rhizopus microsporus var. microsporus]